MQTTIWSQSERMKLTSKLINQIENNNCYMLIDYAKNELNMQSTRNNLNISMENFVCDWTMSELINKELFVVEEAKFIKMQLTLLRNTYNKDIF